MSRNSRKQMVSKIENYEAHIRAKELAATASETKPSETIARLS